MSTAEFSTTFAAGPTAGPLEARHLQSRNYRNAANTARLTSTHWHIAWANGLGWGFDGMDGAILGNIIVDVPNRNSDIIYQGDSRCPFCPNPNIIANPQPMLS